MRFAELSLGKFERDANRQSRDLFYDIEKYLYTIDIPRFIFRALGFVMRTIRIKCPNLLVAGFEVARDCLKGAHSIPVLDLDGHVPVGALRYCFEAKQPLDQ